MLNTERREVIKSPRHSKIDVDFILLGKVESIKISKILLVLNLQISFRYFTAESVESVTFIKSRDLRSSRISLGRKIVKKNIELILSSYSCIIFILNGETAMKIKRLFQLYDKYNQVYFEGKLPFVDMAFAEMSEAFGYTVQETNEVVIVLIAKGMKNSTVRSTLLHEMIHVDQVYRGHKMDHGRRFKMMAKTICDAENIHYNTF